MTQGSSFPVVQYSDKSGILTAYSHPLQRSRLLPQDCTSGGIPAAKRLKKLHFFHQFDADF